jgi:hypothetical protein
MRAGRYLTTSMIEMQPEAADRCLALSHGWANTSGIPAAESVGVTR